MSQIRAVVVDPDAPNRLALADVEEPSPTPSETLVRVSASRSTGARCAGQRRASRGFGLAGIWQAPSNAPPLTARARRKTRGSSAFYPPVRGPN